MADINVEVACGHADRQLLLSLQVPAGTTAREAIALSGLQRQFTEIDMRTAPLGLFGKRLSSPEKQVLEEGDRVEVYRPLLADPKEARKQRAARALEKRQR